MTDQICFSYFCRGSPNNNFCQSFSTLVSEEKMFKVTFIGTYGKLATALAAMLFDRSNLFYLILSKVIQ